MFTLVAYIMARAAAQAALLAVTPAPDGHLTIDGNSIIVPKDLARLMGYYFAHGTQAAAGAVTLGQVQSPALRRVFLQDIARAHDTNTILHSDMVALYPDSPIPLDPDEGLQAWMANGALAAAQGLVGLFLCDKQIPPLSGEVRTFRFTSVTAAVASAWTLGVLAPVQTIPVGQYQVVGARCISAAQCGLFRLIFTGYTWRPGGVITTSLLQPDVDLQRDGWLGEWGRFDDRHVPRIEILGIVAVANPDIYLDLIKVG